MGIAIEHAVVVFMEDDLDMATQLSRKDGGGLFGKLCEAGKRMIAGESFFPATARLHAGSSGPSAGSAPPKTSCQSGAIQGRTSVTKPFSRI